MQFPSPHQLSVSSHNVRHKGHVDGQSGNIVVDRQGAGSGQNVRAPGRIFRFMALENIHDMTVLRTHPSQGGKAVGVTLRCRHASDIRAMRIMERI
jgi:hypothetical protein